MARLTVKVTPNARRTEILGPLDAGNGTTVLAVKLHAPPADGRANEALIDCLASALGVPRRAVSILRGARDRLKVVEIDGIDEVRLRERLG